MKPSSYSRIPNWLIKLVCEQRAYSALALWALLASHGKYYQEKRCYERIFPSHKILAEAMNCKVWNIKFLIRQLEKFGALERLYIHDSNKRQRSNQYILWIDPPNQRKIIEYRLLESPKKGYLPLKEASGLYLVKKIGG